MVYPWLFSQLLLDSLWSSCPQSLKWDASWEDWDGHTWATGSLAYPVLKSLYSTKSSIYTIIWASRVIR